MKNTRAVTPGGRSPNDRPSQQLRTGRGRGLDVEIREKWSVGTGDSATGIQVDPSTSGDGVAGTDGTCKRLLTVEELEASIGN